MYREIIAVCSEIHIKHKNKLCGQNVELWMLNLVADTLPRRFESFVPQIILIKNIDYLSLLGCNTVSLVYYIQQFWRIAATAFSAPINLILLELFDPEDEGNMKLRKVGN
jgi:hypothetical protein